MPPITQHGIGRRSWSLAITLIASLAVSLVVPSSAQAAEGTWCSGYAACEGAGLSTYGYSSNSGNEYWGMYDGHNCTNYVAYRLVRLGMANARPWVGNGNAGDWIDGARSVGYVVNSTPAAGAVAVWAPNTGGHGGLGHVAYVESVDSDNREVTISEDNAGGTFHWETVSLDSGVQFIHILDYLGIASGPTVTGAPSVDATVTANPGTWTQSPTFTYQWNRNGSAISGAGDATYTLTQEDIGAGVSVTVTGHEAGFAATSTTSAPVTVTADSFDMFFASLAGTPRVDSTLTASLGTSTPDVHLSYQWKRNGSVVEGATERTYDVAQDDIGSSIAVTITGRKAGYETTSTTSMSATITAYTFNMFVGSISGTPQIGSTLTASLGTSTPDVLLSYQWKRDGAPISGETDRTYAPSQYDLGAIVSVTITGTKLGYSTTSTTATTSAAITGAPEAFDIFVATIAGTPQVDSTLTASLATQTPDVSISYQWKRNGAPILAATSRTYTLSQGDIGASITVTITGEKPGYYTTSTTATAVTGTAATFNMFIASITGTPKVDSTLTAALGTSTPDVTVSYQWKRNGYVILNAVGRSYTLTQADIGASISVTITGTKDGYDTTSTNSPSVVGTAANFNVFIASVSGTPQVDSTLTASLGTSTPDVTVSYQWRRSGIAIAGATGRYYTLTQSDIGAGISVTITGTKAGYDTTSTTSASVTGTAANFNGFVPSLSGTARVDSTLTASLGTSTPSVSVSYQWRRNGVSISGATGRYYTLTQADIGTSISVRITGTKAGYNTTASNSAAVTATAYSFGAMTANLSGTARAGYVLTARYTISGSSPRVTYQWYRNSVAVSGRTASTYSLAGADVGARISVRVTFTLAGYRTSYASSPQTAAVLNYTYAG